MNIKSELQQSYHRRLKLPVAVRLLRSLKRRSKREIRHVSTRLLAEDAVMFLPDVAYRNERGEVVASLQAWVYRCKKRRRLAYMLARMFGLDIATLDEVTRQIFHDRIRLFMVNSGEGCQIYVRDDTGGLHALPQTGPDGRSQHLVTLAEKKLSPKAGQKICFHLAGVAPSSSADKKKTHEISCFFVPSRGLSIISDIDDTIKQSFVNDKKRLLRATFLEEYQSVPEMRDWYQHLAKEKKASFHYVSSSPIQLYPALRDFMAAEHYPEGSMHLREATRWREILPRPGSSKQHKKAVIGRLLQAFPTRKFILIGDTAGDDALIYAELAAHNPHQIAAICMRCVKSHTNQRIYDKIFTAMPPERWLVSEHVGEMRQFIAQLDSFAHE